MNNDDLVATARREAAWWSTMLYGPGYLLTQLADALDRQGAETMPPESRLEVVTSREPNQ